MTAVTGLVRLVVILLASSFCSLAHAWVTHTPISVAFPPQTVGTTSAPIEVTITNPDSVPYNISAFWHFMSCPGPPGTYTCGSIPFAFLLQGGNCGSLPPGGSCILTLTFAPGAAGSWDGMIYIVGPYVQTLPVTGMALAAPPVPPTPVPTLSQWAMVGLFLGILAIAARSRALD